MSVALYTAVWLCRYVFVSFFFCFFQLVFFFKFSYHLNFSIFGHYKWKISVRAKVLTFHFLFCSIHVCGIFRVLIFHCRAALPIHSYVSIALNVVIILFCVFIIVLFFQLCRCVHIIFFFLFIYFFRNFRVRYFDVDRWFVFVGYSSRERDKHR